MKFSMKFLFNSYILSKDGEQKFPESVEFVPHSHFFLKKEHEVEHEGCTKSSFQKSIKRNFII